MSRVNLDERDVRQAVETDHPCHETPLVRKPHHDVVGADHNVRIGEDEPVWTNDEAGADR